MLRFLLFLKVGLGFYSNIIWYLLKPSGTDKARIAGKCLINKPEGSYRIKGTEHDDVLIVLKYTYRLLLKWIKRGYTVDATINNKTALYDPADEPMVRLDFIESVEGIRPGLYVNKGKVSYLKGGVLVIIAKAICLLLFAFLLFPFSFTKRRAQAGLVLHEIDETATLIYILIKNKIKTVYYSCIFEKDSNAAALMLMNLGFYVIKNPSEDPLYFNNTMLIADELGICNPYQLEELYHYKSTVYINKTKKWFPENHLVHLRNKTYTPPTKHVLGYYSGSSWLRIELNYNLVTGAFNPYKAEAECEQAIADFITNNPHIELRVFLHPLEKKYIDKTKAHFNSIWPTIDYKFEDLDKHTTDTFANCELAITVFSGVMFYRYYAGYKGLLYCPYMPGFPIKNSVLDMVSATSAEQLVAKITETMGVSDQEFACKYLQNKYEYTT